MSEHVVGISAATIAISGLFIPERDTAAITGTLPLDDAVRDALRLEGRAARKATGVSSDVFLWGLPVWPIVIDALFVTAIGDRNRDVATQMLFIDAQSLAIAAAITQLTQRFVGRERPYARACREGRETIESEPSCASRQKFRGFIGGHVAATFTSASLVCVHHRNLPLYGSALADAMACVGAASVAVTTAVLRLVSDNHYFSDVMAGLLVGVGAGFVLPSALHYGFSGRARESSPSVASASAPAVFTFGGVF